MKTRKSNKRLLNAVYNVAGDPSSGILAITSLAAAQLFRNRFYNGTYRWEPDKIVRPTFTDKVVNGKTQTAADQLAKFEKKITELKNAEGVINNGDGTYTVPEVLVSQGNGYDAYANAAGFMRKDVAINLSPQSLAIYGVLALDALHVAAASDNEATAQEAQQVLAVLRDFDKSASADVASRAEEAKYLKARAAAVAAGIDGDQFDALAGRSKPQTAPVTAVEPSEISPDAAEIAEVQTEENELAEIAGSAHQTHRKGKGKHKVTDENTVTA